jgi:hypothetical protein
MRKVLIIVLLAIPGLLMAADPPPVPVESTMNLAETINDSISVPVNAQLTIHIINRAPANVASNAYDISYEQFIVGSDPINTGGVFKDPAAQAAEKAAAATAARTTTHIFALDATEDPEGKALRLSAMLGAEVDETKVPAEVADLRTALADPGVSSETKTIGNTLIDITKQDFPPDKIVLGVDQALILTIHRGPVGALKKQTWLRNFHVGGPGKFVSNYVFGFAPRGDQQFFSKASDPPGKFTITRSVRRDNVSYVPLVLFSWVPVSKGNEPSIHSVAAGLGYDLSNLVVAGSYLWTWHRNLGVAFGVMAQKQQRLKGTYHENDVVTTNLQSTDLTEPVWRPNVFIGISIRSVSALFH